MDFVFEQLRGIAVQSSAESAAGKTLFDYVDAETVQALQQDAVDQTKEYGATYHTQAETLPGAASLTVIV
jgi:hypothetical protein